MRKGETGDELCGVIQRSEAEGPLVVGEGNRRCRRRSTGERRGGEARRDAKRCGGEMGLVF
jgi:hypothetical protein